MAHLIQLRNRIKAIETIKKITHAMRLIAMSSHTRLRNKEETLRTYMQASRTLQALLKSHAPSWSNPFEASSSEENKRSLIILIGSQRGLCGNFNTILFQFFERSIPLDERTVLASVGKKATAYLGSQGKEMGLVCPELTMTNIPIVARTIAHYIMSQPTLFSSVVVISNKMKTFFTQKPHATTLIPMNHTGEHEESIYTTEEYLWEQDAATLLEQLTIQTLEAQLHYLLFQSLIAEQAARFISMDNATRNAQQLLDATKLSYNKLRQAKITKELTELTSGTFSLS